MESFAWTCPFCGRDTTIVAENVSTEVHRLEISTADGYYKLYSRFVVCPNTTCRKFELLTFLREYVPHVSGRAYDQESQKGQRTWRLVPPSKGKIFPDYVPKPIREDYEEACLIQELSPKASATLARRALQGMIRDFWGTAKTSLKLEIDALKERIDSQTWEAIDAVRQVGNIGAHMERDINLVVEVEPEEAELLIGLVEQLVKDWYISRHEREKHNLSLIALAKAKQAARKGADPGGQDQPAPANVDPPTYNES